MRILIHMLPESGHINPTFSLAQALVARGHEVVYTSLLDLQPEIEARHFRCVPLHRDVVPRGRLRQIEQLVVQAERDHAWGEIRNRIFQEYLEGNALQACVREIDPAIVITDVITLSPLQFVAHSLQLPCLQLSTSLSQHHDELPPLISSLTPAAPRLELEAARWKTNSARSYDPNIPSTNFISNTQETFCARFGYPSKHISFRSVFCPLLTLFPEAVLSAASFDFPRQPATGPIFIAPPVELDRRETVPAVLANFIDSERPLIYVSLGSQPGRYSEAGRFFRSVIEAMRNHPEWHAVITAGPKYVNNSILANPPSNVLIMTSVPQLWLLRRTTVFVTHCGLGSVREAIALQIPMIAVPQQYDQPGNALRVEHHNIGIHIPSDAITCSMLTSAVERIIADSQGYRSRLAHLNECCRLEESKNLGVEIIERLAAKSASRDSHSALTPLPTKRQPNERLGWMFIGEAAGLATFAKGAVLEDTRRSESIGVGTVGFTICPELTFALSRASGSLLVRVEALGEVVQDGNYIVCRRLRCLWTLNVNEVLYQYAEWCALQALALERVTAPETVLAFQEMIRKFHALRVINTSPEKLIDFYMNALRSAVALMNRGYGAAAMAMNVEPHSAALFARMYAIATILRVAMADTLTEAHHCEQRYQAIANKFEAEFERQIIDHLRAVQLDRQSQIP